MVRLPLILSASKTCRGRPRLNVDQFVISTSAEIGRRPIDFNRVFSHSGLSGFVTFLNVRPTTTGQALSKFSGKSNSHLIGLSKVAVIFVLSRGFSVPRPAAERSRAIPRTLAQSPRFGVRAISIVISSRSAHLAHASPTGAPSGNSIIPSWSFDNPISYSEHVIPLDFLPRILEGFRMSPDPGIKEPHGAKTPFIPSRAFGAPQTT